MLQISTVSHYVLRYLSNWRSTAERSVFLGQKMVIFRPFRATFQARPRQMPISIARKCCKFRPFRAKKKVFFCFFLSGGVRPVWGFPGSRFFSVFFLFFSGAGRKKTEVGLGGFPDPGFFPFFLFFFGKTQKKQKKKTWIRETPQTDRKKQKKTEKKPRKKVFSVFFCLGGRSGGFPGSRFFFRFFFFLFFFCQKKKKKTFFLGFSVFFFCCPGEKKNRKTEKTWIGKPPDRLPRQKKTEKNLEKMFFFSVFSVFSGPGEKKKKNLEKCFCFCFFFFSVFSPSQEKQKEKKNLEKTEKKNWIRETPLTDPPRQKKTEKNGKILASGNPPDRPPRQRKKEKKQQKHFLDNTVSSLFTSEAKPIEITVFLGWRQ